jgi:hypothetical protein
VGSVITIAATPLAGRALEVDKAWREMVHRYTAGTLLMNSFYALPTNERPSRTNDMVVRLTAFLFNKAGRLLAKLAVALANH